jgi:two-component system, sensor histidine kinase LadS
MYNSYKEREDSYMLTKTIFLVVFFVSLHTISFANIFDIDNTTNETKLLSYSQIYIDKTKKLTIKDISTQNLNFLPNTQELLGFGYSPDFYVWIKFTLHNRSNKTISKIIEYENPLTTHIEFYDLNSTYSKQQGGIFFKQKNKIFLNSIFHITMEPKSTKTYYLKASSHITTLIVKLNLWENKNFYKKEIIHQVILALFFGAMFILGVYNLFIFFFTKDISYLYYVIYIAGLILHQFFYVGFAGTYVFSIEQMKTIIEFASVLVAIPIFALGLFAKSFLHTKQYPYHNLILNTILFLIPISVCFFLVTQGYDQYRNIITMFLLIYLLYMTIYASFKRNKQAYFILFGWLVFVISGILMYLSSLGIFSIYKYFPYLIEISFLSEAIIFSVALANKINNLQQEKNEAHKKLIQQKREETKILEYKVQEKTQDLQNTLDEKNTLLKELNHRVKNNMQMITSLIRLQLNEAEDEQLASSLKTIQNRIAAMSHLHELLYKQNNFTQIKTHEYFAVIVNELQDSYGKNIPINLDIQANVIMEEAIYCGLILNELITNSIKYAFQNLKEGEIDVKLFQENNLYTLEVKDNGTGYNTDKEFTTLGLTLVETLATEQLDGSFKVKFDNGIQSTIVWESHE